jgi:hypothetical protein
MNFGKVLGAGSYGEVREAIWKGKLVAAKSMKMENDVTMTDFMKEIKFLR